MAAVAERAHEPAVAESTAAARPRPRGRTRSERRVASGIVWIAVFSVLLGGIVALNVAVLRLNIRLDQLGQERAKLRGDNASLAAQLSSATASARTEADARRQMHLVPAEAQNTYYVNLASR
jgi:hypothetical protein